MNKYILNWALFGLATLVILVILAIYSIKLSLHFIVEDDKDTYDGFRISEIENSTPTDEEETITVDFEENR
ncbi:hypothetical protein NST62_04975 [Ureibacillus sp. FSL K6-8385]|uniref:Uncharacterized protein n=1 Tax=Ureibacillus terrenus TaxID=118246 RepID=A0A540V6J5_9BACL|nr:hypothetical protein [Ureibacillus terrenus]MED3660646.1 hypothetical protein [Ureibacillus terrenus]MED3762766.1 hypothetical protein [Ureibacillus terrenus]TQE92362.1 hypothetical protein FKZ59_01240 [Ureibacillus terrenus]